MRMTQGRLNKSFANVDREASGRLRFAAAAAVCRWKTSHR